MTLEQWAILESISQIAIALLTLVAVITSLYMSIRAIKEVQIDRSVSRAPFLAFKSGGQRHLIEFFTIPDDKWYENRLTDIKNPEHIRLKVESDEIIEKYRGLYNYGSGPALSTEIIWIPERIWIGEEIFQVDETMLSSRKYSRKFNTLPAGHIFPNQEATMVVIPCFIQEDFEKKISRVEGTLEITCLDVFGKKHITKQGFYLFTGYKEDPPYIHFTFLDIEFTG